MLIKHKLFLNTAILAVTMLFMLLLLFYSTSSLESDIDIARGIGAVEASTLQLRRDEKDFIARKELKYFEKFTKNMTLLKQRVSVIDKAFQEMGVGVTEISALRTVLTQYHEHFTTLVTTQQRIGLDPKDGLYGELRNAVHNVEALIGNQDTQLLSGMLQLRRNEKDFMLRLDEKYFSQWQDNAQILMENVENISLSDEVSENIQEELKIIKQHLLI